MYQVISFVIGIVILSFLDIIFQKKGQYSN